MKIYDLTHEEIIQLNEEDVKSMAKFECASEGIALVSEPPNSKVYTPISFDSEVYEVSGFDWKFVKKSDADEFLNVIIKLFADGKICKASYEWQTGSQYKYIKPFKDDGHAFNVTSQPVFTEQAYTRLTSELIRHKEAEEAYAIALNAYNTAANAVRKKCSTIWEIYNTAIRREEKIQSLRKTWLEYLQIANNDEGLARTFFLKGYPKIYEDTEISSRLTFLSMKEKQL